MEKIPFHKAYLGEEEKKAVCDVIDSGWISQGKKVEEFEEEFAKYTGARYAVAVSSGTSALFLALQSLRLKRGYVAVPSLTFTASAAVIKHVGLEPVFCDSDAETFCLKRKSLEEAKALVDVVAYIDVQLTGMKTPWIDPSIPVVFDCAHYLFRGCHRQGGANCYSFHPTKNMTTGFGGMITTDDEEQAKWLKLARMHGCYKKEWNKHADTAARHGYTVMFPGWKMNMPDLNAALGIEQLKRLDFMNEQKQRCLGRYNINLGLNRLGLHLYPIFVNGRNSFIRFMSDAGIECSVHFEPLHTMPAYKDELKMELPNASWMGEHIVSLPLYVELSNEQIDYVCQKVKETNSLVLR